MNSILYYIIYNVYSMLDVTVWTRKYIEKVVRGIEGLGGGKKKRRERVETR